MRFERLISDKNLLLVLLPLTVACLPAAAQENYAPPNLSDSTGPFLGNAPAGTTPSQAAIPPDLLAIGASIPLPVLMTQIDAPTSAALVGDVIDFNSAFDKLVPFCGCGNVNWRVYNDAVKASKQLRRSLTTAVASEKGTLQTNATPQQQEAMQKRVKVIEDITSALERATKLLTILKKSFDKAR